MLATNFNEFVDKVTEAERRALNSEAGQEMTKKLLEMKLAENPDMTPDEWKQTKSEFMTFIFAMLMMENKELMSELGEHTYNALNAQEVAQ